MHIIAFKNDMEQIKETVAFFKEKNINPEVGIILGTGLEAILSYVKIKEIIEYSDIPNFPTATVEFHKGKLIYGTIGHYNLLIMQGRFHFYEGYTMQEIVFPVRVMKVLGIKKLYITNAAGGINTSFRKGDLVIISDHINLQSGNPLIGKNTDELGVRFPDMSSPYSSFMINQLFQSAEKVGVRLNQGVYVAVNGPNLETRAEYRFLKIIGADMVGMSTVPEVIAANHMQLECAAISIITDECDPENLQPVNISEIISTAKEGDRSLAMILNHLLLEQ